jgi:hypothetical protein
MIAPRKDTGRPSKRIESRGWRMNGSSDATLRIALHAAKGVDAGVRRSISDGTRFLEPYASALVASGYAPFDPWHKDYLVTVIRFNERHDSLLKLLPLGAIIGLVTVESIVTGRSICNRHAHGLISDLEFSLGYYDESSHRRWAWITRDPVQLEPVACRGFQQLWPVPEEIAVDCLRQLSGR